MERINVIPSTAKGSIENPIESAGGDPIEIVIKNTVFQNVQFDAPAYFQFNGGLYEYSGPTSGVKLKGYISGHTEGNPVYTYLTEADIQLQKERGNSEINDAHEKIVQLGMNAIASNSRLGIIGDY